MIDNHIWPNQKTCGLKMTFLLRLYQVNQTEKQEISFLDI
jgi:hypothetical protein